MGKFGSGPKDPPDNGSLNHGRGKSAPHDMKGGSGKKGGDVKGGDLGKGAVGGSAGNSYSNANPANRYL